MLINNIFIHVCIHFCFYIDDNTIIVRNRGFNLKVQNTIPLDGEKATMVYLSMYVSISVKRISVTYTRGISMHIAWYIA